LRVDVDSLANAISMDESAGKSFKEIADYYTIPGNPGNNLFEGITTMFFLNAVRLVHPDISGTRSPEFLKYSNYLKKIYDPYENVKYTAGGGGGGGGYGYTSRW